MGRKSNRVISKRPTSFNTFVESVRWLKRAVYMIARGRPAVENGSEIINWTALGTGFLAGVGRLVTAGHVMDDQTSDLEISKHKEGDIYYLIKHDENGVFHWKILNDLSVGKNLFIYPELDLAILYLEEDFYASAGAQLKKEEDIIPISLKTYEIGTEIGVLGYPLVSLAFKDKKQDAPIVGDVLLRTDKGVINCRYNNLEGRTMYEFTLSFNPGNSGGPIFNIANGCAISIVHAYRSVLINTKESKLNKKLVNYDSEYFVETISSKYSVGIATSIMRDVLLKHNIVIKD